MWQQKNRKRRWKDEKEKKKERGEEGRITRREREWLNKILNMFRKSIKISNFW